MGGGIHCYPRGIHVRHCRDSAGINPWFPSPTPTRAPGGGRSRPVTPIDLLHPSTCSRSRPVEGPDLFKVPQW